MKCIICEKQINRSHAAPYFDGAYCLDCATELGFTHEQAKNGYEQKCAGCIFLSEFRDMGASCPVCVRADERDLVADIAACKVPGPCPWHITLSQVKQLQEDRS